MLRARALIGCVSVVALLSAGCITRTQTFLQNGHRANFALQDNELKQLQFYISTALLARNLALADRAGGVIIVKEGTPGAVVEVGPTWMRVSFSEGGEGVYFTTVDTPAGESAYWIATKDEQTGELRRLKDTTPRVIRSSAGTFELLQGSNARLLVDSGDLDRIVSSRSHLPGRRAQ
jgi:hypothetical protein